MLLLFALVLAVSQSGFGSTYPEECNKMLYDMAEASKSLTSCLLMSSQPFFSSCNSCVEFYVKLEKLFFSITTEDSSNLTRTCRDIFFFGSKVNLVQAVYLNAVSEWRLPRCPACFEYVDGVLVTKKKTEKFFKMFARYEKCRDERQHNRTLLCQECKKDYAKLNEIYDEEYLGPNKTCMDVSNAVNRSRREWAREFKCRVPVQDLFELAIFTGFFLILPPIFYFSMYLNSEYQRAALAKMKRAPSDNVMSEDEVDPMDPFALNEEVPNPVFLPG